MTSKHQCRPPYLRSILHRRGWVWRCKCGLNWHMDKYKSALIGDTVIEWTHGRDKIRWYN